MAKLNELISLKSLVKSILEADTRARNNECFLYFRVLGEVAKVKHIDINNMAVADFILNMPFLGFPSFECIGRTSRKIKKEYPELSASDDVKAKRAEDEAAVRQFAKINDEFREVWY